MESPYTSTLLQIVPFFIALLFISIGIKRKKISKIEIGLVQPTSWPVSLLWIAGFVVLSVSIEVLLNQLGLLEISPWKYSVPVAILRATGAVILAPIVEEIIFRGVFLAFLQKKGLRASTSILLQAAAFMVLHAAVYEPGLAGNIAIAQIFTDGLLFGMARYYTKSLYTSMSMHILGNSIAIIERLL